MIKINNQELINKYIDKYNIQDIFTQDIKPFLELFFVKKNEHLCIENQELKYLYFLVEGKAKVYTSLSNGKSLLLCFYDGFRVAGDLEIFKLQTAKNNVQVIEDSYCIGISMSNVLNYLYSDPKFLRFLCTSLAEKLDRCGKNSSINLLYPLENRLASFLLANSVLRNNSDIIIKFDEPLTQISELLGTSYRHLLRTLNELCLKAIIQKESSYYKVVDIKTLKELAADLYN
jgi:CRP/FNR family putative post-exponential-phase nitrogen-starvation transcriptional regulator